eukprot:CAMPEP_0195104256 /NCGR_PEP_ID=MMETSP0448-20130528/72987_1 /TAXON_ID=66468 /ORGANISM="Heterocapsa triquestra, Strain CCMP 448" /LENGTH=358 /DNA_ID=CAMNT_0040140059 /DNA_START=45 /DNA_END=1121 /DNA_ORIENTATION=-
MRPSSRGVWLVVAMVLVGTCNLPALPRADVPAPTQEASEPQAAVVHSTALSLMTKYQPFHKRTSAWIGGGAVPKVEQEEFAQDVDTFLIEHHNFVGTKRKKNVPAALLTTAAAPLVIKGIRQVLGDSNLVTGVATVFAAVMLIEATNSAVAFAAVDEPKICPLDTTTKRPISSECVEHTGPAVVMCHDRHGSLRTIDFMGVCDEQGGHCMGADEYGGGELWRLEASTGKWKYFDNRGSPNAFSCGDEWESQRHGEGLTAPRDDFFRAFQGAASFFLHGRQERVIQGPHFKEISSVVNDPRADQLNFDFDKMQAKHWINAGLLMLGYAEAMGFVSDKLDLMKQNIFKYAYASSSHPVAQ